MNAGMWRNSEQRGLILWTVMFLSRAKSSVDLLWKNSIVVLEKGVHDKKGGHGIHDIYSVWNFTSGQSRCDTLDSIGQKSKFLCCWLFAKNTSVHMYLWFRFWCRWSWWSRWSRSRSILKRSSIRIFHSLENPYQIINWTENGHMSSDFGYF